MFLKITSDDPDLGRQLCKNPASGMALWSLRRGTVAGWFTEADPTTYNLLFADAFDEVSFGRPGGDDQAAYASPDKLDSVHTVCSMIATALDTRLGRPDEPVPPERTYTLTIPALHVRGRGLHERVWGQLTSHVDIHVEEDPETFLASLTATAHSVHLLLAAVYAGTFIEAAVQRLTGKIEPAVAGKCVRALNTVDAGYMPRYMLKTRLGHEALQAVADQLQAMPGHELRLTSTANQRTRVQGVLRSVPEDLPVIDLGAGGGAYMGLAKTGGGRRYLAVDRDEECRAALVAKAARMNLTTVSVHAALEDALAELNGAPFLCVAPESLEHNEPAEVERLVRLLAGAGCRLLVATCPNRAFNHWYGIPEGGVRREDHVFEPDADQLSGLLRAGFADVEVLNLGDEVDGEPCTLLAVAKP